MGGRSGYRMQGAFFDNVQDTIRRPAGADSVAASCPCREDAGVGGRRHIQRIDDGGGSFKNILYQFARGRCHTWRIRRKDRFAPVQARKNSDIRQHPEPGGMHHASFTAGSGYSVHAAQVSLRIRLQSH